MLMKDLFLTVSEHLSMFHVFSIVFKFLYSLSLLKCFLVKPWSKNGQGCRILISSLCCSTICTPSTFSSRQSSVFITKWISCKHNRQLKFDSFFKITWCNNKLKNEENNESSVISSGNINLLSTKYDFSLIVLTNTSYCILIK